MKSSDGLARVQDMLADQQAEIHRLEDLVFRIMHRRRVSGGEQQQPPSEPPPEPLASTQVPTTVQRNGGFSTTTSRAPAPSEPRHG